MRARQAQLDAGRGAVQRGIRRILHEFGELPVGVAGREKVCLPSCVHFRQVWIRRPTDEGASAEVIQNGGEVLHGWCVRQHVSAVRAAPGRS